MAGGKLSPRQKMINLMYLVFIAMLALNMSKEVLSAFGLLNEKIKTSNVDASQRNQAFMDGLKQKASDEPAQYAAVEAKAQEISAITSELDSYLESLKAGAVEKIEDPQDYEVMDKPDYFNNLFFTGENLKPEGQEFIDKMNAYRTSMIEILNDTAVANKVAGVEDLKENINENFGTGEVEKRDGTKQDWLNYHYEGFPLIASLTKMTSIQNDVKTNQSEILQKMLSGQQAAALSFSNYSTLMEAPKSAYYSGETFDGSVVLGRTDESTVPKRAELTLDGRKLEKGKDYTFEGGKVKMSVGAGSPGDHKIEGFLYFGEGGEEVEVPVNSSFATISKPNAAVISADKMNVVYRGVDNPMTISIPGIPDNKVSASASGLSKVSGSKYVMRPTSGRSVNISASGTLPDGQKVNTTSEFRIKDIPAPVGSIRGETGIVRMQRQGLEISSIGAVLEDFDFDLNLQVTGFSFKVSGQPTIRVNGTSLNGQAKAALRRAGRGEAVQIFDINTNISGSGVKLKKTAPVIIELTN
ncbi:type IX secretion system motor protein PorM/GldM [Luteirhabdus pelagi]|uniref:type IX secretion system motor protein PorM/GldM n=1 Tax=Luteirhabdus pelagi TaxID=2792783 RepID=UPI0019392F29|nr:gliding motility protein GldM [Luteirhabdus pelagi]MCT8340582.1 gliding motility protein GldM [Thermobacterium salinum]